MEGALALDGEARYCVPQRVLQRKPDDHGSDGRGGQQLLLENKRTDERQDAEDDGVLHDGREALPHAVLPQRVDEADDQQVDDCAGKRQAFERPEAVLEIRL